MIITNHFVYIHTSRTAGTFLNRLILEHVPGAQMLQYHGHLRDLPKEYSQLPVIGFVRNPWDWYVSMFFDYRRKQQYVFKTIFDSGARGFAEIVPRFLNLGDNSVVSRRLLEQLVYAAPATIDAQTPAPVRNPGLRSEHFANFPGNHGYYSWLFQLMFESRNPHDIHIGRFENLREEALRLFEITGTPITEGITAYLKDAPVLNLSRHSNYFVGAYPPELEQLVIDKEKYLIDRFSYEFSEAHKYPKTDYFNHLGSADIAALTERVKSIPESLWTSDLGEMHVKIKTLNDTQHVVFRYVDGQKDVFNYHDFPIWDDWKDDLSPIMEQVANRLGYKNYRFPRIMFAKLVAGGEISGHTDGKANFHIHKIHLPLITNPETIFHVGSQSKHLPVGEVVEVNNKRVHAVYNNGEQDRVHFIFECYNMDDYGKPG